MVGFGGEGSGGKGRPYLGCRRSRGAIPCAGLWLSCRWRNRLGWIGCVRGGLLERGRGEGEGGGSTGYDEVGDLGEGGDAAGAEAGGDGGGAKGKRSLLVVGIFVFVFVVGIGDWGV